MNVRTFSLLSAVLLIAACADPTPPAEVDLANEPEMFTVDTAARGPITMGELQFHIPSDVAVYMNDAMKVCVRERVAEMLEEAGDPATLNHRDLYYLEGVDNWPELNDGTKRIILAQAVTSFAFQDC